MQLKGFQAIMLETLIMRKMYLLRIIKLALKKRALPALI